jgi:hypothetical protein
MISANPNFATIPLLDAYDIGAVAPYVNGVHELPTP